MLKFKKLINKFLDLIFSSKCKICDLQLDETRKSCICSSCWSKIELIKEPYCKKCGISLYSYGTSEICGKCTNDKNHFSIARSIGIYDGTLREAIHLFKYKGKVSLANHFSELIRKQIKKDDFKNNLFEGVNYILAVPLHKKKLRKREYNQSLILANIISKYTGIKLLKNCLIRVRTTLPQSQLPREQRFNNVKGVFDVVNKELIKNKIVILIDDVFTTGATINECSKILLKSGAKKARVLTLSRAIL